MEEAAQTMERALEGIAEYCRDQGIAVDQAADPNRTCLIGPELSPLFTSLGQLEAKRTTLSPDMAGLLAHLLAEAGVGEGDRVAVGASGSFPGFLIATLAAVDALGAESVSVLSLGASSYGATRPGFHLADLYGFLTDQGLTPGPPAAVSLGGSGDVGGEFDPPFRERLLVDLRERGLRVLLVTDLAINVRERVGLYGLDSDDERRGEGEPDTAAGSGQGRARGGPMAAFVNIGGATANMGTSPLILNLPPGLVWPSELEGDMPELGMVFEMLSRGVPVVHLLHVRGLALRYGLPWDPLPLPPAGSTELRDSRAPKTPGFWLLTLFYAAALFAVFTFRRRSGGAASG
jgi:poly-gamma-glutamate system protein